MTASPRQSRSNTETEHNRNSIGADGPSQRYTHVTGREVWYLTVSVLVRNPFCRVAGQDSSLGRHTRRIYSLPRVRPGRRRTFTSPVCAPMTAMTMDRFRMGPSVAVSANETTLNNTMQR
jgi:hypothetical protein